MSRKEKDTVNAISRREFIAGLGISSAGILVGGCARKGGAIEVSAVEDLMREHGVLRRALLVYTETAPKLRETPTTAVVEALQKTAELFRTFGEDYHEKKLEEVYIFPVLKKADEAISPLVTALVEQHDRGRQITDYILAVTQQAKIQGERAVEAARVLESFVLMYRNHAAREDTVIFPAWKQALPAGEVEEMGEKFEDIEHEEFGEDGFEEAVRQMTEIEAAVGLADVRQFTAQPPPGL
jgi:hemerythrin-like domain-containing protein